MSYQTENQMFLYVVLAYLGVLVLLAIVSFF
jgi:hypothetical protein